MKPTKKERKLLEDVLSVLRAEADWYGLFLGDIRAEEVVNAAMEKVRDTFDGRWNF